MRIFVADRWSSVATNQYPHVILRRNTWDDFGFRTLFEATLYLGAKQSIELGSIKVLQLGMTSGSVSLEGQQQALGADYCSLGQDIEYYQNVANLESGLRDQLLIALRDLARDESIENQFRDEPGFETSLLRFGQAAHALTEGRRLLRGDLDEDRAGRLSFRFLDQRASSRRDLAFDFDDSGELPGRTNVIIGYNGSGKTRLLADIAVASSGLGQSAGRPRVQLTGEDTNFGAVIAVSYSAFDTFRTPSRSAISSDAPVPGSSVGRTDAFGYVYCGLRKLSSSESSESEGLSPVRLGGEYALKSIGDMEKEFEVAHGMAVEDRRVHAYYEAMELLSDEPSFGRIGVRPGDMADFDESRAAVRSFRRLSTGHKIVVHIMTQLAAHLRPRSLVLIDEPESHLHPPLTAALLKATQHILTAYDSFAIVATHSPVVLQEIPAAQVQVLERFEGASLVRGPETETFGAGVGVVTRDVFSLNSSATDYQGVLKRLAAEYTLAEIDGMFVNGASAQALALVRNYQAKRGAE